MRETQRSQQKLIQKIDFSILDEIEEYSKSTDRFVFINSDSLERLKSSDSLELLPRTIYTVVEQIPEMKEVAIPSQNLQSPHLKADIENVLSESILTNEHIRTTL